MPESLKIVMIGATGAVGGQVAKTLAAIPEIQRLTLLGRRPLDGLSADCVHQHTIDVFDSDSYRSLLPGHHAAICTVGVGEPSKVSKENFVKIDKEAVLEFAKACKEAGVHHFELLGSVASSSSAWYFYLRIKGELQDELRALEFERLSLFQPSMILTPTNRYGLSQAITLKVWPLLRPLLVGGLRKYRGIPVATLGRAMALNVFNTKAGVEELHWDEFVALADSQNPSPE